MRENPKSATKFMQFYAEGTGGKVFIVDRANNLKTASEGSIKVLRFN